MGEKELQENWKHVEIGLYKTNAINYAIGYGYGYWIAFDL